MKKERGFNTGKILLVSFAHLTHDIYSSFINPLLPLLIEKLQISFFLGGFLAFMQRLPSIINPLIGILADKFKRRTYFIIFTPAITAISMSFLGISSNFFYLNLLCLIAGFSVTFFHVPAPVIIKEYSGNKVGKGMSFYMFGGEIARTIGPIVLLGGVSFWGLGGIYRLLPLGIGTSILLYFKLRDKDSFKQTSAKKTLIKGRFKKTLLIYRKFFLIFMLVYFFRGFLATAFTTFLPTYMKIIKGNSLWISGISLSVVQLAGAVGAFLSGMISDRIGRRKTLLIIFISSPLFMILFLLSKGIMVFISLLLVGFTLTAPVPVILAMHQELKSENKAFINSIFMFSSFFIRSLTIVIFGLIGDIFGLECSYIITFFMAIVAIPVILKLEVSGLKELDEA